MEKILWLLAYVGFFIALGELIGRISKKWKEKRREENLRAVFSSEGEEKEDEA